jgi:energy-converting hydrogenase Eha subunit E
MLWLAPISLITAFVLLAFPYIKHLNDKRRILLVQGVAVTVVSLLGFLVGPLFKPPVLAQVNYESRTVIGNLYDAFIATFNNQLLFMTLSGLLLVIIATAWIGYPHFKKTLATIKK